MTDRPAALALEGIHKTFGSFVALADVSLRVEEGAFVAFLGPSGCGKTTLLRIIAGLDRQSAGQVWQQGREVSDLPPARRDFGIVFQSYALFPNLTVERNVGFGLENGPRATRLAPAQRRQRVAELLDLVGLADQARKYPAQLSGGQQQRVGLARALASSPSLLLLDEPLSALDAKVRQRLRGEIKALQRCLGLTTIMVTHDQEEALSMADQVVVMNKGRLEQVGAPRDIYRHPANAFVAGFVGTINVLAGHRTPDGHLRPGAPNGAGGTPVTVCLRPEDIQCQPLEADAPDADALAEGHVHGILQETEFLGPVLRAHVRVPALWPAALGSGIPGPEAPGSEAPGSEAPGSEAPGPQALIADLPAAQAHAFQPGRPVRVFLPAERLRCFPPEGGTGLGRGAGS
ncbi:ABC transporter ATP-binding protein [Pararhodospirillum oryzae]|uniref:Fe(3+) ions import ATP-binding protein FbpC n=1 Tax=Pararhodospirillum oryzae TaxID=478448 RepID=A0A512H5M5_9PROT|nr:ATP-binding cassette domain-containing protein [Pararhodospirillum oryzae]GEO80762.1 Fe(3+) ions import ATP-binding protein FbpC [Pararhodospirillum oryzae]